MWVEATSPLSSELSYAHLQNKIRFGAHARLSIVLGFISVTIVLVPMVDKSL